MSQVLNNMLVDYKCQSLIDYIHALKEISQKITLLGLWRAKFFEKAAFYGGTALRILYNLDRFSEDLDFSLLAPNPNFNIEKYTEALQEELQSYGIEATIKSKAKNNSNIKTILINLGLKKQLITLSAKNNLIDSIHRDQKIMIKMEVDTNPPLNFETEQKILLQPIPFYTNTFKLPDLFSTKIHAILCRTWGSRVKGRDWYDFIWYIGQKTPLRIIHLQTRLEQSGIWPTGKALEKKDVTDLLYQKLATLDIMQAKSDILPFIANKASIDIWSQDFFKHIIEKITVI